jgi:hypothetical protein
VVEAAAAVTPPIDDPLQHAIAATIRAEQLQRQAAQQPQQQGAPHAPEGLSEYKQAMLARHPELYEPFRARCAAHYWRAAMEAGIPDDTEQMDQYILQGVERELQRQRDQAAANAAAMAQVHQAPPPAPAAPAAPPPMPQTVSAPLMPPASPARKSIPVAAPVSREVPTASGQRVDHGRITISAEEADIARRSRPDLPGPHAERLYAENKLLLAQRRARGEYPMPESN